MSMVTGAAETIAFVNHKGGIGKTTTTLSLGAILAARGRRVLMVDLDPQANLTISAGLEPDDLPETVYTLMVRFVRDYAPPDLAAAVRPVRPGLDLLPASIDLAAAEREFITAKRADYILQRLLEPAAAAYDLILIDCPPSLGFLTVNALTAATTAIIPLTPEFLPARGLAKLLDAVADVRNSGLNPALTVSGVIFTMVRPGLKHAAAVTASVRDYLGDEVPLLGEVKRSTRAAEATEAGVSIIEYDPRGDVAQAYTAIADRVEEMRFAAGARP